MVLFSLFQSIKQWKTIIEKHMDPFHSSLCPINIPPFVLSHGWMLSWWNISLDVWVCMCVCQSVSIGVWFPAHRLCNFLLCQVSQDKRIAERKTLISSHSVKPRLYWQCAYSFFVFFILFCLIFLLFPICSAHYVIKAINMFMERLFHVAIKHKESQGDEIWM